METIFILLLVTSAIAGFFLGRYTYVLTLLKHIRKYEEEINEERQELYRQETTSDSDYAKVLGKYEALSRILRTM